MSENVMLDLETLGTRPGCAVIAIGAVKFTSTSLTERFYCRLPWVGRIEPDTVRWWLSDEVPTAARLEILKPATETIEEGLLSFRDFVGDRPVWGNGADFDNAILQNRYGRFGIPCWDHRQNRCYRTLRQLYSSVPKQPPKIPHHALEDAISQARHAMNIFNKFGLS